jgi:hypothetical protein
MKTPFILNDSKMLPLIKSKDAIIDLVAGTRNNLLNATKPIVVAQACHKRLML